MEYTSKCKFCGGGCGEKFALCAACNEKYKKGEIIICDNEYVLAKEKTVSAKEKTDEIFRDKMPTKDEFRCDDGHYVKSLSEQNIDNWLYNHDFVHKYEPLLTLRDSDGELRQVYPDFYVKSKDLYIEFWGMDTEEYLRRREEKERLYKLNGINYISLTFDDMKSLDDILLHKIKSFDRRKR